MATAFMTSPLGDLKLEADKDYLLAIDFLHQQEEAYPATDHPLLQETIKQMKAYFKGTLKRFDLPFKPKGTPFQEKVWSQLTRIPYGEVISYKTLAIQIGHVKAVRAVGSANGQNRIPIIIPCHRVIGNKGQLVGYSGGLWRKKWLLSHEGYPLQRELFKG